MLYLPMHPTNWLSEPIPSSFNDLLPVIRSRCQVDVAGTIMVFESVAKLQRLTWYP